MLEEPFEEMCSPLVEDVIHPEEIVRKAAAPCLARTLECHTEYIVPTLELLLENYDKQLEVESAFKCYFLVALLTLGSLVEALAQFGAYLFLIFLLSKKHGGIFLYFVWGVKYLTKRTAKLLKFENSYSGLTWIVH